MKTTCRRITALLCAVFLSVTLFSGCGNTAAAEGAASESSAATASASAVAEEPGETTASAQTVQVQSIDGNTVTAIVGELAGSMPDMEFDDSVSRQAEPPELPDSAGSAGFSGDAPPEGVDRPTAAEPPGDEAPGDAQRNGADAQRPEMPDGEAPTGNASEGSRSAPGGASSMFIADEETIIFTVTASTSITVESPESSQEGTIDSLVEGAVLDITLDSSGNATDIVVKSRSTGGFGGSTNVTNGTSANTISEDGTYTDETYASSGDDENALRIDGAAVTLDGVTVEKSGGDSSNTEDGDFYGQNAALLALNSADVTVSGAAVHTDAVNGNGVFSYGEGTIVNISNSVIHTVQNNSGGIHTTGGGVMNATNLDVETQGNSAAAIRSDRGGGAVTVDGGTYTSNGTGSPAIYSTADISVANATLTSTASEAIVVEGRNSISIEDCTVSGNMDGTYGETGEHIHNIMIYQSMSGDAEVGEASFSAQGGSIVSQNGDMFYVTNTSCTISLSDVALTLANDTLLSVEGNDSSRGWGAQGANGGDVVFTADAQTMEGRIHVDEISTLGMTLSNGAAFTGSINSDGQEGDVHVTLDSTSSWALTADSYITSFDGDVANITSNGFSLYVNGEAVN